MLRCLSTFCLLCSFREINCFNRVCLSVSDLSNGIITYHIENPLRQQCPLHQTCLNLFTWGLPISVQTCSLWVPRPVQKCLLGDPSHRPVGKRAVGLRLNGLLVHTSFHVIPKDVSLDAVQVSNQVFGEFPMLQGCARFAEILLSARYCGVYAR